MALPQERTIERPGQGRWASAGRSPRSARCTYRNPAANRGGTALHHKLPV